MDRIEDDGFFSIAMDFRISALRAQKLAGYGWDIRIIEGYAEGSYG